MNEIIIAMHTNHKSQIESLSQTHFCFQVFVWGGISRRGSTPLAIFAGTMESDFFYNDILNNCLLSFIAQKYPDHHRLFQDNDPKHTSQATAVFMQEKGINWWKSPAESPDINVVENIWAEMKFHIRTKVKPDNQDQLIAGLREFWATVTVAKCNHYIDHIMTVLPEVVKVNGGPTKY